MANKNSIEVIKCGVKATTKISQIEAIVTAISIRFNRTSYELSYFNNGEYKTVWLDESEFTVEKIEKTKIGFN